MCDLLVDISHKRVNSFSSGIFRYPVIRIERNNLIYSLLIKLGMQIWENILTQ